MEYLAMQRLIGSEIALTIPFWFLSKLFCQFEKIPLNAHDLKLMLYYGNRECIKYITQRVSEHALF